MFVHTFEKLIPVEKYFTEHPEWFSPPIHGKRIKDGQLCLSNPWFWKNYARIWNLRWIKINGLVGPFLTMTMQITVPVMHVIDWILCMVHHQGHCSISSIRLPTDFRNKTNINFGIPIYPHSLLNALFNRQIMWILCSVPSNAVTWDAHWDQSKEQSFVSDMIGWKRITNNIFLWDYVVQFPEYDESISQSSCVTTQFTILP